MGDPVRIADLAKNMIRLSGYEPEKESRSNTLACDQAKSCMRNF